mmetsp:Transcript_65405/g.181456  ORF Transcript_65405/g.181456 Transcript_65405/m.181456 type:complete len:178 (-) Transcript_65405:29-562(-)
MEVSVLPGSVSAAAKEVEEEFRHADAEVPQRSAADVRRELNTLVRDLQILVYAFKRLERSAILGGLHAATADGLQASVLTSMTVSLAGCQGVMSSLNGFFDPAKWKGVCQVTANSYAAVIKNIKVVLAEKEITVKELCKCLQAALTAQDQIMQSAGLHVPSWALKAAEKILEELQQA